MSKEKQKEVPEDEIIEIPFDEFMEWLDKLETE